MQPLVPASIVDRERASDREWFARPPCFLARSARRPVTVMLPESGARRVMSAENVRLDVLYEDSTCSRSTNPPASSCTRLRARRGTVMNALLWHARGWQDTRTAVHRWTPRQADIRHRRGRQDRGSPRQVAARDGVDRLRKGLSGGGVRARERGSRSDRVQAHTRSDDRRKVVASTTVGAHSLTSFERVGPCGGAVGRFVAAALPSRHRTYASDSRAPGGTRLAAGRRSVYGEPARAASIVDAELAAAVRAFPRQALHAWRVAFTHPMTGNRLCLEAPRAG